MAVSYSNSHLLTTTNNILIIGAFDRYNYGDLLFPLIIEKQLETYDRDFTVQFFGIVKSDLSPLGGKPTASIREFYRTCNTGEGHTSIIVAGGEAVAVTWNSLLLALSGLFKRTHRFHHRIGRMIDLNALAKWVLGGKTDLPFVFTKEDFTRVDRVILNSLGGSELDPAMFNRFPLLADQFRQADYFAVRDRATVEKLRRYGIATQLYPDSAILMVKFFPEKALASRVSPMVRAYVTENRRQYVFFQMKDNHAKKKERFIAEQLDQITASNELSLCFCPIGKALNHDDQRALRRIAPYLKKMPRVFDNVSIWDIMYLIAHARVYMGTSLHGAITAMSYAVPYVGLEVVKLHSYLNTWGVEGLNRTFPLDQLYPGFLKAMAADQQALNQSRDQQLMAAEASFSHIQKLVLNT